MSKELLFSLDRRDFELQTFKCGGHGGQNVNKRETGVRLIHRASGAVGESCDSREQKINKRLALQRLSENPKFKVWLAKTINEMEGGPTIEQKVDELMQDKNLKIEGVDEQGKWIELEKTK